MSSDVFEVAGRFFIGDRNWNRFLAVVLDRWPWDIEQEIGYQRQNMKGVVEKRKERISSILI